MDVDILPAESSQLGHATNRNGVGAHKVEFMEARADQNSVLILFGTVTGNAESLAQRIAEVMTRRGFNVRVKDRPITPPMRSPRKAVSLSSLVLTAMVSPQTTPRHSGREWCTETT
jgi:sulfite reductase alpha subunit-like flavoprotein